MTRPHHLRVLLTDLLTPGPTCSEAYDTAVEKLALGLSRDRMVVLRVPEPHSAAYANLLGSATLNSLQSPTVMVSTCPGSKTVSFRAASACQHSTLLTLTYGNLESTARAALAALCRSRLLRLRGDTFSPVLDDLPLPRSQQGSSLLTLRTFVDNFKESSEGQEAQRLFADPQEETTDRGLLSIVALVEARDPDKGQLLSVMQVKDAAGTWRDVVLEPNELVLMLGHTMRHATAGILSPSTYRVVGAPYGSTFRNSRRTLHFELRPRPAAVLDFTQQLADAGHQVPLKFSGPMSVRSLEEQFEALMSPSKELLNTPQNMEGAAAHSAWDLATCKKGRKRSLDGADLAQQQQGAEEAVPVTRSGAVRRTSGGLVNQHRPTRFKQQAQAQDQGQGQGVQSMEMSAERDGNDGRSLGQSSGDQQQQQGPASGGTASGSGASRSMEETLRRRRASVDPSSGASGSALYFVRGHTCTVLDDCLQDLPSECVALCVRSFTGIERWFYLNRSTNCGRVFETYCDRMGVSLAACKFLYMGKRVFGADTPASLQVGDGAEFTAVPESSERAQQARELGPLYSTLFAVADSAEDIL